MPRAGDLPAEVLAPLRRLDDALRDADVMRMVYGDIAEERGDR